MRPCLTCGDLSEDTRCEEHTAETARVHERERVRLTPRERGYDAAWIRLSKRARRLQPWCLDCGTTSDLSADHLPQAWIKHERGEALTLADIEVVCLSCNAKRETSRPGSKRASAHA